MPEENNLQNIEPSKETKPDLELVDAKDFPWLDLNFYDKVTSEFQLEGFALIGDIEFVCFSDFLPRCFRRTMSSTDGTIVAEFFHEKVRGFDLVLRLLLGNLSLSCKGIHLTTEFSDGSFLYTVTGKKRKKSMSLPIGMTKQYVAAKTPVRDMIEIHKDKIRELHPDKNALTIRTFQQWVESFYREMSYAK